MSHDYDTKRDTTHQPAQHGGSNVSSSAGQHDPAAADSMMKDHSMIEGIQADAFKCPNDVDGRMKKVKDLKANIRYLQVVKDESNADPNGAATIVEIKLDKGEADGVCHGMPGSAERPGGGAKIRFTIGRQVEQTECRATVKETVSTMRSTKVVTLNPST